MQRVLSSIFGKIYWVNFLMSFFWKFNFLPHFSKSKNEFIFVLVGGIEYFSVVGGKHSAFLIFDFLTTLDGL